MRGHHEVIHIRETGKRPAIVFLNDAGLKFLAREYAGDNFSVCLDDGEQPEWLDLRFLVGLTVSVSATSESRARRFLEACKGAGAATVAVCSPPGADDPWSQRNYAEVWRRG